MTYSFEFDIEPVSKERPRFSVRGGKARTYTAPKTRVLENTIAMLARKQLLGRGLLEGALVASVVFEFQKPKKTKLTHPRPDTDNLFKSLADSLNGIVFNDDTQIVSLHAHKRWKDKNKIRLIIGHIETEVENGSNEKEDRSEKS